MIAMSALLMTQLLQKPNTKLMSYVGYAEIVLERFHGGLNLPEKVTEVFLRVMFSGGSYPSIHAWRVPCLSDITGYIHRSQLHLEGTKRLYIYMYRKERK